MKEPGSEEYDEVAIQLYDAHSGMGEEGWVALLPGHRQKWREVARSAISMLVPLPPVAGGEGGLTRADFGGDLWLHARCHISVGTRACYVAQAGALDLFCRACNKLVTRVLVEKGR